MKYCVSYTAGSRWVWQVFCVEENEIICNNFVQYVRLMVNKSLKVSFNAASTVLYKRTIIEKWESIQLWQVKKIVVSFD